MRSYTYADFLRHPRQPERICDLPMVKAVVKALDTVAAFTSSAAISAGPVTRFGVVGLSKLGLTAWMAAAADPRVEAIAPLASHAAFEENQAAELYEQAAQL